MLWDVFCQVIDNFGDIGVCWRLSCDLGSRGHDVRLWVDDASALAWMAPSSTSQPGVSVHAWADATRPETVPEPGDVVIEAFGCNPPEAFVARMQRPAPPRWVNLEYLSAESYVERSHGLASPVWSGPGQGLVKRFFYPGFTPRTGGLLREPGLLARQSAFASQPSARQEWLAAHGITPRAGERLISLFCYGSAPVPALLDQLTESEQPVRVLLTPGHATRLARDWLQARNGAHLGSLALSELPALPQAEFDTLLWCCDLNLVRGEDSAVRALWAGRPHVWQIYEQDDGVHADKLEAFMARWMAGWPTGVREPVAAWWRAWNRLGTEADSALPPLPDWQPGQSPWALASLAARQELAAQDDLATQLKQFVASSG
jgi:uncharacterized repeat protein (TIGR03837 family)